MILYYSCLSLYNKAELISELPTSNRYDSDEGFLEAGYEAWGVTLFEKLNGDFAFALYDEKKDVLYAGRDALGVKVLYYVEHENEYIFSENIDALFEETGLAKQVSRDAMKTVLEHMAVDYEATMYEGIKRVPPGHYLQVKGKERSLIRYWFPEKIETNYDILLEEASDRFGKLFEKAIVSRMGTDEETAYELSGGLDSSSVVSLLKNRTTQNKIDTYSMAFENLQCDESRYISAVEEKYGFSTTRIASENIDYDNQFDFEFNYEMNPHWPITTTFTMMFPMVRKMHEDGKRIILTGQGGDHLLTGNCSVLADLFRRRAFDKVWREFGAKSYAWRGSIGCGVWAFLRQNIRDRLPRQYRVFKKRKSKNAMLTDLFMMVGITSDLKKSNINALVSASQSTMMDGNALHALESLYQVEFRHPFYDKELVEYVLSLPPEYLQAQGWIKTLLRYAMEDILPEKIRSRRNKADFFEVLIQQLKAVDFKSVLEESSLVSLGLIKQKKLDKLIREFEKEDYRALLHLWTVVNVEYWYQHVHRQK